MPRFSAWLERPLEQSAQTARADAVGSARSLPELCVMAPQGSPAPLNIGWPGFAEHGGK